MMRTHSAYSGVGAYCPDCEVMAAAVDRSEYGRYGGALGALERAEAAADEHNTRRHGGAR